MRTIKFRGQRLGTWEWLYGSLLVDGATTCIICDRGYGRDTLQVDPKTVSQFTGLFDTKGREIYDGDILDTKVSDSCPNGYQFLCEWIDSGFSPLYQGKTYGPAEKNRWLNSYPLCQANVKDVIVIGNKFDNPNLVKRTAEDVTR